MLIAIDDEKEELATQLEQLADLVRSGDVTGLAYCVLTKEQYWVTMGANNPTDFAFLSAHLSLLQHGAARMLVDGGEE